MLASLIKKQTFKLKITNNAFQNISEFYVV